jgi:hypothetical protein
MRRWDRTNRESSPCVPIRLLRFGALLIAGLAAVGAPAQQIEPRAYANAPVGVNFAIAALAHTDGGVAVDPALPLEDARIRTRQLVFAYARTLDLWGSSGKIATYLPYAWLDGSARLDGDPREREVDGTGDARVRLSMNFFGAPALSLAEFRGYEQDTIVGASLEVSLPTGQYDSDKLVNIGSNRWSVRPEFGVSQAFGALTTELTFAATLFSDNDDFFGGQRREQSPLYSTQAHLVYALAGGAWVAATGTYVTGGEVRVDGRRTDDCQRSSRVGLTVALPVDRRHSVKLFGSTGVSSRSGEDFDLLGAAWQYRWGGGL